MSIGLCRTLVYRNSSVSSSSSPTISQSNITDAEWITNGISLLIFILAFVGNTAALVVMFGKRGPIRLTNNKYLANLACADLLRACFMPFTIIARMKRNFIFGRMICKILPIVQGLSVAVDVFTLVCISIERYLAICRPLLILKLQSARYATLLNALILILIWVSGLIIALPNVYMYNLCSLPTPGRFKCEKTPLQVFDERIYMVALDAFYFVIPLVVMIVLYALIIWKMYRNSTANRMRSCQNSTPRRIRSSSPSFAIKSFNQCCQYRSIHSDATVSQTKPPYNVDRFLHQSSRCSSSRSRSYVSDEEQKINPQFYMSSDKSQLRRARTISHPVSWRSCQEHHRRQKNLAKKKLQLSSSENSSVRSHTSSSNGLSRMDRNRRRALKLLITLIVEFFICWTPLFIYHTIGTFNKNFYRSTPNICVDLILLFSFASASCNPLTYYFMSKRYRSVLYAYLPCCFLNQNQRMCMNEKNQQTRYLMKALRSSEKQKSVERKQSELTRANFHRNSQLKLKAMQ